MVIIIKTTIYYGLEDVFSVNIGSFSLPINKEESEMSNESSFHVK
jgi:hypothetical protein